MASKSSEGGLSPSPPALQLMGICKENVAVFACLKWQVCAPWRGGWQLQRAPGEGGEWEMSHGQESWERQQTAASVLITLGE